MNKRIVSFFLLVMLLLAALVPTVAAEEESNIVEIAVADGRFDTLAAAVVAADLADALSSGSWTVFAPTDDAFAKLGLNADNIASKFSKAELTDILLYHALEGNISKEKAKTLLGDVKMANGHIAGLKYFDGSLYVNDDAKVIIPDVLAANGVIHVVDNVILGPWPKTDDGSASDAGSGMADSGSSSIVDIAVADGRFDTLVAAVVAADLADALSSGSWTVFAPTDDAFAKLGLNADNIASKYSKAELTDILLYHALKGNISSEKAKTLLGDVKMANGHIAGLKYFDGSLYVNDDAKVIIPDILAANGVVHVVDNVVLGPWPK